MNIQWIYLVLPDVVSACCAYSNYCYARLWVQRTSSIWIKAYWGYMLDDDLCLSNAMPS